VYPIPIQQLIKAFSKLPSVGPRTAERFVFHLLRRGKRDVAEIIKSLENVINTIESCPICWDFSDQNPCVICRDTRRNHQEICVVDQPQSLQTMERTKQFTGVYHVLRGTIDTSRESAIESLKINELLSRIKKDTVDEIILALSPDLQGENTMLYLEHKLRSTFPNLVVSRLARGLPMGSDIQYADDITLRSALRYRTKLADN
jgi:recombination protein RecR